MTLATLLTLTLYILTYSLFGLTDHSNHTFSQCCIYLIPQVDLTCSFWNVGGHSCRLYRQRPSWGSIRDLPAGGKEQTSAQPCCSHKIIKDSSLTHPAIVRGKLIRSWPVSDPTGVLLFSTVLGCTTFGCWV